MHDMGHHPASHSAYELRSSRRTFPARSEVPWEFEVIGPNGRPKNYQLQHEKELHLIVVRNDLSTFAHVHPERLDDGSWATTLEFPKGGPYTAFADVAPEDAEPTTLRLPLTVEGPEESFKSHEPLRHASVAGYEIDLVGEVEAGSESQIHFDISLDGDPVTPEPYLGAAGHLVAIREGDLDYLHVHPMESSRAGTIPFMMHAAQPGCFRLFLQFQHRGEVRTADFTLTAT